MDEVDYDYQNSIREALQSGNVNRLIELVPSLSEQEANDYISSWNQNYLETMQRIRNSQDTDDLVGKTYEILNSLMDRANSSGYKR